MKNPSDLIHPSFLRCLLAVVLGLIGGQKVRVWAFQTLLGYTISPTATLGVCFISANSVELGPRSRIGHFSFIRNLERLELGADARIGTFNWIFGMLGNKKHFAAETQRRSALLLDHDVSITSRHIIDCTDEVQIGAFSTIAGFSSQILTHGIDIAAPRQSCAPVRIGPYTMIGSACVILKGSVLPKGTILASGSTFRGTPSASYHLYSGVPAVPIKPVDPKLGYFTRETGAVS